MPELARATPAAAADLPPDWPHHERSRFVTAGGLRWHLQVWGEGSPVLLLHGTGASTHSWRMLAPWLVQEGGQSAVLTVDLPGQGHSQALPAARRGMAGMAAALAELLAALDTVPHAVVGHSAGAALMLRLALDGGLAQGCRLVGLNAALQPFAGLAGLFYPSMARLLTLNPLVPRLAAWRARDLAAVRRLIAATGSTLDEAGLAQYAQLLRQPAHVAGVLSMMSDWDLEGLQRDLPGLHQPLWLLVGERDAVVPPWQAWPVARRVPGAVVHRLSGLGHLMHEEDPARVGALLRSVLVEADQATAARS